MDRKKTKNQKTEIGLINLLEQGASSLLEWIFPSRCPGCLAVTSPGTAFCSRCIESIHPIAEPLCPRCYLPFPSGPSRLCGACAAKPPPFRRAVALFEYGGQIARAVQRLKYGGQLHVARTLGRLMTGHLEALAPDLLVPVPLHPSRLRRRGFNQATELARYASAGTKIPVAVRLLERRLTGQAQASATLAQRRNLPVSTFAVPRPDRVEGRSIVVLDDVLTTGATARAASRVLKKAGARRVDVLVLCRTVR